MDETTNLYRTPSQFLRIFMAQHLSVSLGLLGGLVQSFFHNGSIFYHESELKKSWGLSQNHRKVKGP